MSESLPAPTVPAAAGQASPWHKKPVVVAGLATLFILAVLGWGLVNNSATHPTAGTPAPNFDLQFFKGYEWQNSPAARLSDMQGHVVVLNFWASWCVECRLEADLLEATSRNYRDRGVVFLGVAYVDTEPQSLAYMREYNITYPNAPDLRGQISNKYKITGVPETYFIGKNGTVENVVIGPLNQAQLIGTLEQLLQEETGS